MKLLFYLLNLSPEDQETLKDCGGWVLVAVTWLSGLFSPVISFIIGILTVAVLLERWKYYRNQNRGL